MRDGTVEPNGKEVERLRTERGWSQEELAARSDCSKKTIENVEASKPAYRATLAAIARAFGPPIEVKSFLAGSTSSEPLMPTIRTGNAPPLPSLLIGRRSDLVRLTDRLSHVGPDDESTLRQRLTIVRGWPGVGKTTVTRAIAHWPDITISFPDGVLWAALGPSPSILGELIAWGRALGDNDLLLAKDITEASHRLAGLLHDRRMLLIVDDVWEPNHLVPFAVGGRFCAMLVTTRLNEVADSLSPTPDDIYRLEVLSVGESLELLHTLAPKVVTAYQSECRQLVQELEGLPLALQVAGRMLRVEHDHGWSVVDLLHELHDDQTRLLSAPAPVDTSTTAGDVSPTVAALLRKSTDCLDPAVRMRFAFLAPFAPRPATFEFDDIKAVWRTDDADTRQTIDILVDRGLLEPIGNAEYQIHQILVKHAKTLL